MDAQRAAIAKDVPMPTATGRPGTNAAAHRWRPANDTERALVAALARDDRRAYFQIVAAAPLYLPAYPSDPRRPDRRPFATITLFGQVFLPVFTSREALAAHPATVPGFRVTGYPELRAKWPVEQWRLAVNPGTPADAWIGVDDLAAAADGELTVPTAIQAFLDGLDDAAEHPDLAALRPPEIDIDAVLAAATRTKNADIYLQALLSGPVIMPTGRPVDSASDAQDPAFPWRPVSTPDGPAVQIFTSDAAFTRAYPTPVPFVRTHLVALLVGWPPAYDLTVNPGDPASITLAARRVAALLLWPGRPRPPA